MQKMYDKLAEWWPLISPVEDYAEEAAFFAQLLAGAGPPAAQSLLELGSGGGNNAFYLKKNFAQVTLTDLSPAMLALSRALNQECEHVVGDMRLLRLGRSFDAIFVHDAIDYMTTPADLRRAFETAFLHCEPGGMALFVPDYVREIFQPSSEHAGRDGQGRALRFLEWTYDPDPGDDTYVSEYVYLLRESAGPAWVEHERHTCGLFARATWLRLLKETGFRPEIIRDAFERELFLARRPNT